MAGGTQGAHAFQRHAGAKRSVEGAAFRHGVEMRARHDARTGLRSEASEQVVHRVAADLQSVTAHLAGEPVAHGHVFAGITDTIVAAGYCVESKDVYAVEQATQSVDIDDGRSVAHGADGHAFHFPGR
jgi:hypothetical protein